MQKKSVLIKSKVATKKWSWVLIFVVLGAIIISIWGLSKILSNKTQSSKSAIRELERFVEKDVDDEGYGDKNCVNTNKPYTFYFFAMKTCPHCIDFDPIWRNFVSQVQNNRQIKDNVCMKKILSDNEDLLSKYNVRAFPTLLLINNKTTDVIECNSERTVEALTQFLLQNIHA